MTEGGTQRKEEAQSEVEGQKQPKRREDPGLEETGGGGGAEQTLRRKLGRGGEA